MKVSLDHERLINMLKESISLLCKSALEFNSEMKLDGLLGITLDKEDVVLVSIQQTFQPPTPRKKLHESDNESHTPLKKRKLDKERIATKTNKSIHCTKEDRTKLLSHESLEADNTIYVDDHSDEEIYYKKVKREKQDQFLKPHSSASSTTLTADAEGLSPSIENERLANTNKRVTSDLHKDSFDKYPSSIDTHDDVETSHLNDIKIDYKSEDISTPLQQSLIDDHVQGQVADALTQEGFSLEPNVEYDSNTTEMLTFPSQSPQDSGLSYNYRRSDSGDSDDAAEDTGIDSSGFTPVYVASHHVGYSTKTAGYTNFMCYECSAPATSKETLMRHYRRKHGLLGGYRCTKCIQIFKSKTELEEHNSTHHVGN